MNKFPIIFFALATLLLGACSDKGSITKAEISEIDTEDSSSSTDDTPQSSNSSSSSKKSGTSSSASKSSESDSSNDLEDASSPEETEQSDSDADSDQSSSSAKKAQSNSSAESKQSNSSTNPEQSNKSSASKENDSSEELEDSSSSADIVQSNSSSSAKGLPEIEEDLGYCYTEQNDAKKNEDVVWIFKRNGENFPMADVFDATFIWKHEGFKKEGVTGSLGSRDTTSYATVGTKKASLQILFGYAQKNITCNNSVLVTGNPITGCTCESDATTLDLATGDSVMTWKVSGCNSDAPLASYAWSIGNSTKSYAKLKFDKSFQYLQPKVTITNEELSTKTITCNEVKSVNSEKSEYTMKLQERKTLPAGSSTIEIDKNSQVNSPSCSFRCTASQAPTILTIGKVSTQEDYYVAVDLDLSYCQPRAILEIELTRSADCEFLGW